MIRTISGSGARRRCLLIPAVAVWLSLAAQAALGATRVETPADVVSAVVKLDDGKTWAPVFDVKPTALMLRYFTAAFNASWTNAMKHNQEEPVLDGDPITGGQGITSLALRSVKSGPIGDAVTTVVASLSVRIEGVAKPTLQAVTFTLRREGSAWRIDDLSSPVDGTLRAHFLKSYGR